MCVYIYVHIHIYMCMCIHIYLYTYVYICIYLYMCDMTHLYESTYWSKHTHMMATTIIHDTTHSYVWDDAFIFSWHDLFICVTWLIHMCDMTDLYMCDMTHPYECTYRSKHTHMIVTTIIHDTTHSYMWHDEFICVIWRIHIFVAWLIYVWYDSFICVTWLIYMCDMTHSYERTYRSKHTHVVVTIIIHDKTVLHKVVSITFWVVVQKHLFALHTHI